LGFAANAGCAVKAPTVNEPKLRTVPRAIRDAIRFIDLSSQESLIRCTEDEVGPAQIWDWLSRST
jgi:hypothetical protein